MRNPLKRIWRRWLWERKTNPQHAKQQLIVAALVVGFLGFSVFRNWDTYGLLFWASPGIPGVVVPSTVETGRFDGTYVLKPDEKFNSLLREIEKTEDTRDKTELQAIVDLRQSLYGTLRIHDGILSLGQTLPQEFSLRSADINGEILTGKAIYHEDIYDPGDSFVVYLRLERHTDGTLDFSFSDTPEIGEESMTYQRVSLEKTE